jgi:VanZ family protein
VLVVSITPGGPDLSAGHLDKLAHLCEYLLFAWLLVQAIRATGGREPEYRLWAWMYATSYGLLIELLQMMVPWRSAEWGDVAANAVGAACGVWIRGTRTDA